MRACFAKVDTSINGRDGKAIVVTIGNDDRDGQSCQLFKCVIDLSRLHSGIVKKIAGYQQQLCLLSNRSIDDLLEAP